MNYMPCYVLNFAVLLIFLVFSAIPVSGNEPNCSNTSSQFSIADMDGDGIADSLIYDNVDLTLTIKLSSKDFESFTTEYPGVYESGVEIQTLTGGFAAHSPHMRASNTHTYFYEEETGRFRLAGYGHEHIHCGWMNVDLVAGKFTADWHSNSQFSYGDSIVYYPPVNFTLYYDPIYLGDVEPDFMGLGYNLLSDLEGIYIPPSTDTVRVVDYIWNHDGSEPEPLWEYYTLIYIDTKGYRLYDLVADDSQWPNRDDIVEICYGYIFCHHPNEDKYVVERAITRLKIRQPGALSEFYRTNTKNIKLIDQAGWAEYEGELIRDGVYSYFAVTKDKKIKKYMDKPGTFEVVYSNTVKRNDWRFGILMDLSHNNGKRNKHLSKVVLGITHDHEFIYFDESLSRILQ